MLLTLTDVKWTLGGVVVHWLPDGSASPVYEIAVFRPQGHELRHHGSPMAMGTSVRAAVFG